MKPILSQGATRFSFLILSFCILFSSSYVHAGAKPSTSAECVDLLVLFARGSGQNIDHQGLSDVLDESFYELEKESYSFFKHHEQRFIDDYPNITYKAVSVHDFPGKYDDVGFKAVPVGYASLGRVSNSVNADASWAPGEYRESVKHGTAETVGFLQDQMQQCPDQYYIVGGYSQGAQIMGDALFQLDTLQQSKILGVGFFGDPKYIGYHNGISQSWRRGEAKNNDKGMLEARLPYVPDGLQRRTVSWCSKKDFVCAGWSAYGKESSHSSYSQSAIPSASYELTSFAAPQLMALERKRVTGSGEIPSTRISKADRDRLRDVMFLINDNSNESVLRTFKFHLDPILPTFTSGFAGTRYGGKTFAENDWGKWTGDVPRYTHIQALTPLVGFDPSRPSSTGSNLVKSFGSKYKGVPFILGGGDIPDPYQLAIERTVVTGNWRTETEVERNIVMIVDRPPKDPYQYNICSSTFRNSMKYPDINSYKNCFTDPIEESWSSSEFPEACKTIVLVLTKSQCAKPLTAPTLYDFNKRTNQDAVKIAQANRVKISIVIPHEILDTRHPFNDQTVLTQMKSLAEATGGIFINYSDKDRYSPALLQDTLYQVFTKKQRSLSAVTDGSKVAEITSFSVNQPIILDVSHDGVPAHSYQWDLNNDGSWETESNGPVIEYTIAHESSGNIAAARALDQNGMVLAEGRFTYKVDSAVAPEEIKQPQLPDSFTAQATENGNTYITWQPGLVNQSIVIIDPTTNHILATALESEGSSEITGTFESVVVRAVGDESASDPKAITVQQPKYSRTTDIVNRDSDSRLTIVTASTINNESPVQITSADFVSSDTNNSGPEFLAQENTPQVASLSDKKSNSVASTVSAESTKPKFWIPMAILLIILLIGAMLLSKIKAKKLSSR